MQEQQVDDSSVGDLADLFLSGRGDVSLHSVTCIVPTTVLRVMLTCHVSLAPAMLLSVTMSIIDRSLSMATDAVHV